MRKEECRNRKTKAEHEPSSASFAPARLRMAGIGTSQCPGVLTRGSQRRLLPSHIRQGCSGVCVEAPLPAYSGVTVWAFHPLRVVTGETSVWLGSIHHPRRSQGFGIRDSGLGADTITLMLRDIADKLEQRRAAVARGRRARCSSIPICSRSRRSPTASASGGTAISRTTTTTSASKRRTCAWRAACSARSRGCGPAIPARTRCRSKTRGRSCACGTTSRSPKCTSSMACTRICRSSTTSRCCAASSGSVPRFI